MYKNIQIYQHNQNSSGTISQQDKSEILNSLNSNLFKQRFYPKGLISISIIDKIDKEIEQEIQVGKLSWEYRDNCHTWAAKVHRELGLNIVTGYLCRKNFFGQSNLKLTAHSVVKNCNEKLVELTTIFSPDSYLFIEHNSGKLGIDLEAQK